MHPFVDVAKYLNSAFACFFVWVMESILKEIVVLICEALFNVEVCLLPFHDYYSAEAALGRSPRRTVNAVAPLL